jgi:hypothetical protein
MSSPDQDDVSPSPEPSADYDEDMAAEQNHKDQKRDEEKKDTNGHAKSNAKDPLRPRRKKARRACFACQRAHLTCGEYQNHFQSGPY